MKIKLNHNEIVLLETIIKGIVSSYEKEKLDDHEKQAKKTFHKILKKLKAAFSETSDTIYFRRK